MKRLKPLIKLELKNNLILSLYFLAVTCLLLIQMVRFTNNTWKVYLQEGMTECLNNMNCLDFFQNLCYDRMSIVWLWLAGGIVIFVLMSYRYEKNHEVGRFIKSLPFTLKERMGIKMGMGIFFISLDYLIMSLLILSYLQIARNQFQEIFAVTVFADSYKSFCNLSQAVAYLLLGYLGLIALYLFMLFMEQIVNHNIGSVVIGVLTLLSPQFIALSLMRAYGCGDKNRIVQGLGKIVGCFSPVHIFDCVEIKSNLTGLEYISSIMVFNPDKWHNMLWVNLGVIVALIIATFFFASRQRIENSDQLISHLWIRGIFVIGVSVCSGFLAGDLYYLFILSFLDRSISIVQILMIIVGAVMGAGIAIKITALSEGRRKKA